MLTAHSEKKKITVPIDMGAVGYITKDSTVEEIVQRPNLLLDSISVW
jgi:DNA-binding NarL/FixJ family response regulator